MEYVFFIVTLSLSPSIFTEGLIPGIIHGLGLDNRREDINIAVNSKDIHRECRLRGRSFMCTPYYLLLEGGGDFSGRKEIVLANLVHNHPIKYDNVLTVNWVSRLLILLHSFRLND